MELAVKYVYQQVNGPHGTKMEAGQRLSLCFRGRQYMLCVINGYPLRVLKRPVRDFDLLRTVTANNGKEVKVSEVATKWQELGKTHGITVGASRLLDRALQQAATIEDDEDQFNDEEELTMETPKDQAGTTAGATDGTTTNEETATVSSKKKSAKAKAKAPKGKATKSAKAKTPKKDKGPSRISQAVEYMAAEVKKEGGQKNLERGWRKELFERAAKKFDLSPITCSIQYNRQVLNKGK